MEEEQIFRERKEKAIKFLKAHYTWLGYIALAIIIFLAVKIRTSNLSGLRDITTGQWTLGPDLDPFLFLRWAKYIIQNGSLMAIDTMRNVPLGLSTRGEMILLPYLIAWFHKIAEFFGSTSIEQSAAIFPVFMFALTVIAFFFLTKKIFVNILGAKKSIIIALISSFFLSVIPSLLPRTIAGIPEKESAAFLFMFLAFYFFLSSWDSKNLKGIIIFAVLAAISTAAMALVWGGYVYVFVAIGASVLIAFLLGHINRNKFYTYAIWILLSAVLMIPFSSRYSISNLLTSTTTGIAFGAFFLILLNFAVNRTKLKKYFESGPLAKLPMPVMLLLIVIILSLIFISFIHSDIILDKFNSLTSNFIQPIYNRFGVTVAENRQPFFGEWAGSFGPIIKGIPLIFWLFFIGSVYLFYNMLKTFAKKERLILTASYLAFLTALIFSRYSAASLLNGTNGFSIFIYILGIITLVSTVGFYYFKHNKLGDTNKFRELDFGLITLFVFFFLSIVSARGAVRTIMVLVPPASIIVSYLAVVSFSEARKVKDDSFKLLAWIIVAIILISTAFAAGSYYKDVSAQAASFAPNIYTQQWQKAMSWVRDNTPSTAVFAHWWDYGYWLQSIGERATVLDGGNFIVYWNHLMGRYALIGNDNMQALEFLYAHNATHFLIDSTDIGKYSAFSSIGSDGNYDRFSWLNTFVRDNQQTQETKNSTIYIYSSGGVPTDGDIIYNLNGTQIFLPGQKAGIAFIILEENKSGTLATQPHAVFVYQNKQYNLPLRYAYINNEFKDFGSGIEAGVYLMPAVYNNQGSVQIVKDGALIYLSNRTVKSQLARLYLYKEDNPYFKLVHSEDDFLIAQLKSQNATTSDIVFVGDIRGPVRIWEINYPAGMQVKQEYLQTTYPDKSFTIVK